MPIKIDERMIKIDDTIRDIEKDIRFCSLGEGIIKKAFDLGWYTREFTKEEVDRIYSLDKKIREHCQCAIKTSHR